MKNDSKVIYFIRMIAGGYLIYLAIPMLKGVLTGDTGKDSLVIGIGSTFFLLAALGLIIHSVYTLIKQSKAASNQEVEADLIEEAVDTSEVELVALEENKEE